MKLNNAVIYFKSQRKIAEILGLHESAVSVWKERGGGIIPIKHIIKLKDKSKGELDLNLDDYR
jgi:hypothetical protein